MSKHKKTEVEVKKNRRTKTSLNNKLSNVKHPTFYAQRKGKTKASIRLEKGMQEKEKRTNKKENDQTSKKLRWVTKLLQEGLKKT